MGMMKRYLEDLSEQMGYEGEINDEVMAEAERTFDVGEPRNELMLQHATELPVNLSAVEVVKCAGCGNDFCAPADGKHDLCKSCAVIACDAGCDSYADYVNEPNLPFYPATTGDAVPFPTDHPHNEELI